MAKVDQAEFEKRLALLIDDFDVDLFVGIEPEFLAELIGGFIGDLRATMVHQWARERKKMTGDANVVTINTRE